MSLHDTLRSNALDQQAALHPRGFCLRIFLYDSCPVQSYIDTASTEVCKTFTFCPAKCCSPIRVLTAYSSGSNGGKTVLVRSDQLVPNSGQCVKGVVDPTKILAATTPYPTVTAKFDTANAAANFMHLATLGYHVNVGMYFNDQPVVVPRFSGQYAPFVLCCDPADDTVKVTMYGKGWDVPDTVAVPTNIVFTPYSPFVCRPIDTGDLSVFQSAASVLADNIGMVPVFVAGQNRVSNMTDVPMYQTPYRFCSCE